MQPVIPDDPSVIRPTLESVRKAFYTGKTKDISFRIQQLQNLARGIKQMSPKLDEAVEKDIGLSPFLNFMASTTPCLNEIEDCIRNVRKWSKPVKVNTPVPLGPARSYIVPEPFGVCLVISAWNYPLVTLIPPIATAIAAGNCVIAKPSEMAPHTSKVVVELFQKYLDNDCYTIIEGQVEVAKAITREKFDVLVFTGSPEKGKLVAKAAAENLVPCILELGGKSPTIIDQDANIDNAAMRVVSGRFLNAGQTCIAPDYVFAHKDIKERFLVKLKQYKEQFHGEDAAKDPHYAKIINEWHTERLKGYLDENHGGKVVFGGEVDVKKKYVAPTVVDSPSVNSKMMQDEIFGPILPVFEFTNIDTVIKFINDRDKPLALYYYGSALNPHKDRLIQETSSGAVMVNDSVFHILNSELPFGGVGNSGYGVCHGKQGFDCLSHRKPVMEKYSINMFPFNARYPPYTTGRQKMIRLLFGSFSITQYDALRVVMLLIVLALVFTNWECMKSFGKNLVGVLSKGNASPSDDSNEL